MKMTQSTPYVTGKRARFVARCRELEAHMPYDLAFRSALEEIGDANDKSKGGFANDAPKTLTPAKREKFAQLVNDEMAASRLDYDLAFRRVCAKHGTEFFNSSPEPTPEQIQANVAASKAACAKLQQLIATMCKSTGWPYRRCFNTVYNAPENKDLVAALHQPSDVAAAPKAFALSGPMTPAKGAAYQPSATQFRPLASAPARVTPPWIRNLETPSTEAA